jgi:hypothetical protein
MVVIIIGFTALGGPWPPLWEMIVLLNNTLKTVLQEENM